MVKVLKMNKGVEESILDLLKHLLESGKVTGVFALKQRWTSVISHTKRCCT
jgi:hypothetical protein